MLSNPPPAASSPERQESDLLPPEIVRELDRYIIAQDDAKRAVAIALRNRWRRLRVTGEIKDEITPKNIIMIGPTGVGKTERAAAEPLHGRVEGEFCSRGRFVKKARQQFAPAGGGVARGVFDDSFGKGEEFLDLLQGKVARRDQAFVLQHAFVRSFSLHTVKGIKKHRFLKTGVGKIKNGNTNLGNGNTGLKIRNTGIAALF